MSPRDQPTPTPTGVLNETDQEVTHPNEEVSQSYKLKSRDEETPFPIQIVWTNVILMTLIHMAGLYGLYLGLTVTKWQTNLFGMQMGIMFLVVGVNAGAHRLWTHRSFKAKLPLRILMMICNTASAQNNLYDWCRDHRVHHKFSETNGDPHNAKRGFFFSHVGWLLCKKHPDVREKGKTVDCSDLLQDPVVRFQRKYYFPLLFACWLVLPCSIPILLWGEPVWNAVFTCVFFRYIYTLNGTWLVNSAAHLWGGKPYDKHINPSENTSVIMLAFGEGYHNYHHTYPWDYKAAELPLYKYNLTAAFIDLMAKLGQAYDLKTVDEEVIRKRALRTGDGSHHSHDHAVWGWGDKDMTKAELDTSRSQSSQPWNVFTFCLLFQPPMLIFLTFSPMIQGLFQRIQADQLIQEYI